MYNYDTFEDELEMSELVKRNQARSIGYMKQPSLWDMPTITSKIKSSSKLSV